MKLKTLSLVIISLVCTTHGAIDIITVSPYINKGVSFRLRFLYNDLMVAHHYEARAQSNQYSRYVSTIYLTPHWDVSAETLDPYVVIGDKKEKVETTLLFFTGLIYPRQAAKLCVKFNVMDKGENVLFRNVAISPFFGLSLASYIFTAGHGTVTPPKSKSSLFLSSGAAFGS